MTDQWLVRKLLEQDKKIEALSRGGTGVGHTSIAQGEALTVLSDDGEVVLGAGGVDYVDGPTPATPSAPTLKLGFGTIEVTADGTFAEGEDENGIPLVAPIDFDVFEVHCSTDPLEEEWGDDTRRGQIKTREGGTITVGGFDVDDEVFVCLIALAKTGKRSAPSATASLVIEGLDFSQLFNELDAANATIKNAGEVLVTEQGTLGEKLAESDAALDALEVSLGELDETTLPALRQDLDAAEGRLDSAEGQITDAFGQLAAVPGQIDSATQDALILAATDAQARADAAQAAADEAARAYAEAIATGIEPVDLDALRDHMNTKAAQAKQAAIDAAALDATAKANAAKSQAQAWDTALSTSINNTIDQARTDLTADINAIRTSANGKNTVTWSTSNPPTLYSGAVNDTWFVMSGAGSAATVLSQWRWNGDVWVSTKLSQAVLAQIDIGTGTFGEMNGARLKAGTVSADKISVGIAGNLLPDPLFLDPAISTIRQNSGNRWVWKTVGGETCFESVMPSPASQADFRLSDAAGNPRYIPVAPNIKIVVELDVSGPVATYLQVRYSDGQDATPGSSLVYDLGGGRRTVRFVYDLSAITSGTGLPVATFSVSVRQTAGSVAPGVATRVFSARVSPMIGGTVIEGGAVTTDKLAANVLEVGNLKAGTAAIAEAVVQKIAAQTASIQQADVKNLFVTGTSSLSNVVAERIAAETAKFIQLEVGNLVAGTGTMDTATINKLFADVVVAGMSIATEFIGENAILTGAVTASKITASEELWAKIGEFVKIRAEQLEADAIDGMVITGPNIRTAASGARVQLDAGGLSVYDSADDWQVRLTPDGSSFKGDLEANSLVANGAAEFKSTDNMLAQGAKLTLAAGVTDPTAPPIVQPYWDGLEFDPPSGFVPAGLAFDGTYYWTATLGELYDGGLWGGRDLRAIRVHGTTGAVSTITVSQNSSWGVVSVWGVTCIGSELFWLCQVHKASGATISPYFAAVIVTNLSGVEVRRFDYPALGYGPGNPLTYKPGIGNDGTNVVIAQCSDSGSLVWRTYNKTTGAAISYVDANDATKSDISGIYIGAADHGGGTFATIAKTATKALPSYTTSGVYAPERSWRMADDASETGIVFADGKFRTLNPSGTIREYANATTGDGSGDWWCAYRWETDTDSDGAIDYRSKISPPARFTWPRRARLKATGQPKPAGVELMAGFLAKKATKPARTDFKRNYTGYSTTRSIAYWDWYQNTGDAPADGNTYPTATPSSIASASGTFQVKGDGSGKWGPLTFNTDGTIRGATAAGEAIVPINAANANRTLAVTFATGRFKTPPTVVATPVTPNPESVQVSVNNITATGFTMVARRTVAADAYVRWVATEG